MTLRDMARRHFPRALRAFHEYRWARAADRRPAARTPHGFLFTGRADMQNAAFESLETAVVQELARGGVYVDVGAHHGYFVAIARKAGAHAIAIEPLDDNLTVLYENLMLNGWSDVEVFPVAVAAQPGTAELYGAGTGASLVARWAGASTVWHRRVPVSTLDVILSDRFPDEKMFVKIDAEGSELAVLEGAAAVLARAAETAWMIEICFRENQPGGAVNPDFAATFERMWRHGYRARAVSADRRDVQPDDVARWLRSGVRDVDAVNFVFERSRA